MYTKKIILFLVCIALSSLSLPTFANELNNGNIVSLYGCDISATSCNLSDKDITSIATGTFTMYGSLQTLYLNGNPLTGLGSGTFNGLTNLQTLGLMNAQLTTITTGTFAGLDGLIQLNLGSNQLTRVTPGMFVGPKNLVFIQLARNQITEIDTGIFAGMYGLWGLDLSFNQLTSVTTGMFAGSNVGSLFLSSNHITNIDTGAFTDRSTQFLDLQNNQLTSITTGMFAGMPSLQRINLQDNQLTSVTTGAFADLTNLQQLYLQGNQLTNLDGVAFTGLTKLQKLYLQNNQLTSITMGTFAGLTTLQQLYLQNNQLTSITTGMFAGLPSLQQLNLVNNQLTSIPTGAFAGLTSLQQLDLQGNPLVSIGANILMGDIALTNLDLSYLQIASIGNGAFAGIPNLQQINLQNNQLTSITMGVFAGIPSLQQLNLQGNQLTYIEDLAFDGLTNLQQINLQNNQLTSVTTGAFAGLPNLQQLNLQNNQLTSITTGAFAGLPNLQQLNLQGNQLTHIEDVAFAGLTGLISLNISFNQFISLINGAFDLLSNLQGLNLGGNQLTTLSSGIFLGLRNLSDLEIYNNQISNIDTGTFDGLPNLGYLDVSSNCSINGSDSISYNGNIATLDNNGCVPVLNNDANEFIGRLMNEDINYTIDGNGYVRGSYPIGFIPGSSVNKILTPLVMVSQNSNRYRQDYYHHNVEVQYESGTTITRHGQPYTGVLNKGELYITGAALGLISPLAITRFGSLVHEIDFDQPVTIRIPALGKNIGDQIGIYSSEQESIYRPSNPRRVFEGTGTVEDYNGVPYVIHTTQHASRWALAEGMVPDTTPPIGIIIYDITGVTIQHVTATISLDEPGIITNNGGSNQHIFTENGTFTFTYQDTAGNKGESFATVNWITAQQKPNQGGGGGGSIASFAGGWIGITIPAFTQPLFTDCSTNSSEDMQSFCFAKSIGATTTSSLSQAAYTRNITREELAKIVVQYDTQILNKTPNTSKICGYSDTTPSDSEMKGYIKEACQLGLMGVDNNGNSMGLFRPSANITRGEYMTVISRMLYGKKYEVSDKEKTTIPFYQYHMANLIKQSIFTQKNPKDTAQRYVVFYTLWRLAKK